MLVNAASPGPSAMWKQKYSGILDFLRSPLSLFGGDYDDFGVSWFQNVGTTITTTLVINVAEPHVMYLIYWLMMRVKICCYRRGQVMQYDLNALYTGFDFQPEVRYPQVRFMSHNGHTYTHV